MVSGVLFIPASGSSIGELVDGDDRSNGGGVVPMVCYGTTRR